MECFAGFLSHTDEQLGRLLAFLDDLGERDDTIVVLVSDNGASAEGGATGSINDIRLHNMDPASEGEMFRRIDEIGGPSTHNNYPWGWTMAGNSPFRRWKREVHEGGIADPCIVAWPKGPFELNGVRHQFAHAIDVMPTIAELVGIELPTEIEGIGQSPVDGTSFAYVLSPEGKKTPERHDTQYFEMFGSRAIYHDGWKAVAYHAIAPLYDDQNPNASFDEDVWELYDVTTDLSETRDLSAEHPDRLAELIELWWQEAGRNQVLPLDNRVLFALVYPKPDRRRPRDLYRYFPGGAQVPESVAVNIRYRSHALLIDATIPPLGESDGVLLAQGSVLGGWSLHILDSKLRYVHNLYGKAREAIESAEPIPAGEHHLEFVFTKDEDRGGLGVLSCDGREIGRGTIGAFTPSGFNGVGVGLTCGYEWGPAVGDGYTAPFRFPGTIHRAVVETRGPVVRDPLAEMEAILSEQ
jgi:arylsulfatase